MSDWLRWQYVLPRLLLCVVTGLAAQFTADLLVRALAAQSATALVGAPVDITNARISLTDGQILVSGLTIADPRCPNRPWIAADSCEIELEFAPLSSKQTIVEKARLSGLRLSAQSTDSDPANGAAACMASKTFPSNCYDVTLAEAARDRLTRIEARFKEDLVDELDSVKRVKAIQARIPDELAALENRTIELQQQAQELEKTLSNANKNQLRHDSALESVPAKVASVLKELEALGVEFDRLPQRLENERRKVIAARRNDEQLLLDKLRADSIDPNAMNAYLLGELATRPLEDVVSWFTCIDRLASTTRQLSGTRRGQDVIFTGVQPTPSFLIRTLEVHGHANVAGQSLPIHGQIANLSTTPALLVEPINVRLSTDGPTALELRASIDRTNGRACDEVLMECRDIQWDAQSLGRTDQLQVQLSPSKASLLVSVRVQGNCLTGDVQLVQKAVDISTTAVGKLKDLQLSESLDASLRNIKSFATRITVGGTLDRPYCTVWSNLGPAVVESVDRAVAKHAEEHTRIVLAEARRVVDERLATLERQVSDQQAKFAQIASGMPAQLEQIARHQTRRQRISIERIGRRLPDNSILR